MVSLCGHEAAHAWAALRHGDDTAKRLGRLTLNPLAHIDPLGTVLLPLVGAFTQLPVIGWAKPVPVDLRNTKHPRRAHLQIALAGPLFNLLLATACLVAVELANRFFGLAGTGSGFLSALRAGVVALGWVNTMLALFNALPLPPLDGAAVVNTILPPAWAAAYERAVAPYGFVILMVLLASGGLRWLPDAAGTYARAVRGLVAALA